MKKPIVKVEYCEQVRGKTKGHQGLIIKMDPHVEAYVEEALKALGRMYQLEWGLMEHPARFFYLSLPVMHRARITRSLIKGLEAHYTVNWSLPCSFLCL